MTEEGFVSVGHAARALGVSDRTADKAMAALVAEASGLELELYGLGDRVTKGRE